MVAKENNYETCRVCFVLLKTSDIILKIISFYFISAILLAPRAHAYIFGRQ